MAAARASTHSGCTSRCGTRAQRLQLPPDCPARHCRCSSWKPPAPLRGGPSAGGSGRRLTFKPFRADGNLFHFLCGGDPSFGQQPPQRQLRQQLGCAHHPEGRLLIYIDNCGVFCWNGRFRAVRHPDTVSKAAAAPKRSFICMGIYPFSGRGLSFIHHGTMTCSFMD